MKTVGGRGNTWVFFGWVCAAQVFKFGACFRKNLHSKWYPVLEIGQFLTPHSRNCVTFNRPFFLKVTSLFVRLMHQNTTILLLHFILGDPCPDWGDEEKVKMGGKKIQLFWLFHRHHYLPLGIRGCLHSLRIIKSFFFSFFFLGSSLSRNVSDSCSCVWTCHGWERFTGFLVCVLCGEWVER